MFISEIILSHHLVYRFLFKKIFLIKETEQILFSEIENRIEPAYNITVVLNKLVILKWTGNLFLSVFKSNVSSLFILVGLSAIKHICETT